MKKILRRIILVILIGIPAFVLFYIVTRGPIVTGLAAKGMCTNVFFADKDPERIYEEDLSFHFLVKMSKAKVNYEEKSVTVTLFGLAKRKAVFREGLGAVIVLETPEEELKAASFEIPDPGYSQDTIPWPKGDVLPDSLPEGVDYASLETIIGEAFDPPDTEPLKKTLGVAVVYNNVLIGEEYKEGYNANTIFQSWSVTKSLNSAMLGILVGDGKIDIKAAVDIPEWKNDDRGKNTLENLLHMNSGLKWVENYGTISGITIMLMQKENMYEYVTGLESEYTPGSSFNYSGGDINLISGLIRRAVGNDEQYHQLPYTRLFNRIGMLNTIFETDVSGTFVSSSYSFGTTRDWARFGLLYLNDGIFEGDTILAPGWVDFTRQPAPNSNDMYAGSFWLQEPDSVANKLKDVPDDVYFADGFLGQRIYIIPSKNLVVVRMGYGLDNFGLNNFLRDIISTLPE
ncbi:serine hydrolase domain-containing protein [Bacteroidota bacterium]